MAVVSAVALILALRTPRAPCLQACLASDAAQAGEMVVPHMDGRTYFGQTCAEASQGWGGMHAAYGC